MKFKFNTEWVPQSGMAPALALQQPWPWLIWLLFTRLGIDAPSDFPTGGIVAVCKLAYVVTHSIDPWFTGPYGFVLRDVRPVEFVSYPGSLGLFGVPSELVREVVNQ